ncbi:putative protein N(5)-glutamine methyltransferase [Actinomadura barringtoniae]|uniref:peptide chain release factor N(5)-glutamine methyltransferase n=1 Tax=Actinomadura barringtoniae TaxID=1427535 RepID=A0A939PGA3_9ACTN|nr:putative protein N(5)-glutamine methyltransferase [Actinomadura barringtoniae]MBO2451738.1 putative protein N(5)-glutamine methyltransferase [Actinomadura barringtoniae]
MLTSASSIVSRLRAAGCVFAEEEADLLIGAASASKELDAMVERRAAGEPLEYVLGWAEFCGLRVAVAPGVFVPRRRTEFLVRQAAGLAVERPVVVDLCCGTGALGLALASMVEVAELHAADVDPAAVACARRNVADSAADGHVYEGDLYEALPPSLMGRVDVLLCNVPYVPTGDVELLPSEARDHEHRVALDGGADGLDVLRRVTGAAPLWLAPGGHLLFETSERQVPSAIEAVERSGLNARVAEDDEMGATVVIGTRPSA